MSELGTGDVQVTLIWNTLNDLDLHVTDPAGEEVYFNHPFSASGAILDVDANLGCNRNITPSPVENIFWPTGAAPRGAFRVEVNYYEHCRGALETDSYTVRVLVDGKLEEFTGTLTEEGERDVVYDFSR